MEPEGSLRCSKSLQLVPILSQINPIHPILYHLRSILILSNHLRLCLPSGLFPTGFPTNVLYVFLLSPIRVTCPAHLILLTLSFSEKSTSYEAPHYAVFSNLLSLSNREINQVQTDNEAVTDTCVDPIQLQMKNEQG
jgi:hypothetical protein